MSSRRRNLTLIRSISSYQRQLFKFKMNWQHFDQQNKVIDSNRSLYANICRYTRYELPNLDIILLKL